MAQVRFIGLNIVRAIKRECLVLLSMFLKHLRALVGFSPSKGFFVTITTLVGGIVHNQAISQHIHNVSLGN